MKRIPNWEAALAAWQLATPARSFAWGQFDCALAACDAVLALTGVDLAARFRGTYSTEAEAVKLLGSLSLGNAGLGEFAAAVAAEFGMAEVAPAFAHRGDVVLVDNETPGGALGIVDLSGRFAWCVLERGMVRIPMERWLRAWDY